MSQSDLLVASRDLVQFLRRHGYCAPGVESLIAATEEAIEDLAASVDHREKERS
jgi:hypothetical protein